MQLQPPCCPDNQPAEGRARCDAVSMQARLMERCMTVNIPVHGSYCTGMPKGSQKAVNVNFAYKQRMPQTGALCSTTIGKNRWAGEREWGGDADAFLDYAIDDIKPTQIILTSNAFFCNT